MKKNSGGKGLAVLMLLFGLAALVLRKKLYLTAVDAKGLLVHNHPMEIALAALTAAVLAVILLAARRMKNAVCFEDCYCADLPAAFGNVAAGSGILVTVLTTEGLMGGYLENIWYLLGLLTPVCLLLAGIARLWGKKPFFLLHVAVCLFFVVHIVNHYQLWSSNPQMQDYVFSFLGAMALMFFGFYAAAMEVGCGSRRMTVGMGLAAIYLCMAELARSACPALYLGGILWVLADLCSMQQPAEEKTEQ